MTEKFYCPENFQYLQPYIFKNFLMTRCLEKLYCEIIYNKLNTYYF